MDSSPPPPPFSNNKPPTPFASGGAAARLAEGLSTAEPRARSESEAPVVASTTTTATTTASNSVAPTSPPHHHHHSAFRRQQHSDSDDRQQQEQRNKRPSPSALLAAADPLVDMDEGASSPAWSPKVASVPAAAPRPPQQDDDDDDDDDDEEEGEVVEEEVEQPQQEPDGQAESATTTTDASGARGQEDVNMTTATGNDVVGHNDNERQDDGPQQQQQQQTEPTLESSMLEGNDTTSRLDTEAVVAVADVAAEDDAAEDSMDVDVVAEPVDEDDDEEDDDEDEETEEEGEIDDVAPPSPAIHGHQEPASSASAAAVVYGTRHRTTTTSTIDAGGREEGSGETAGDETALAILAEEAPLDAAAVATATTADDSLERIARDALGDLVTAREKEHSAVKLSDNGPVFGSSFLSDSLTEEERRTRTRYLPQVEGMHMLRKTEIKGDLALARLITSSSGVSTSLLSNKSKAKQQQQQQQRMRDENSEMATEDAAEQPSEDDRASSTDATASGASSGRPGNRTIDFGAQKHHHLVLPSAAFVAPDAVKGKQQSAATPKEVEAITAFNPPRPPESVGPKKKHRLLRWERRPSDIEVDLGNYRKTVQKTREELRNAELERNRIETVDNHLRQHYLNHLECLNVEMVQLYEQLVTVQQECVVAADLLTSRTRSRGTGKNSNYVMRDVLTVLRTRGAEMKEKGIAFEDYSSPAVQVAATAAESSPPGIGGVGATSVQDWDRSTVFDSGKVAQSWIVPGDRVSTPCGEGHVLVILPASELDVKAPLPDGIAPPPPTNSSSPAPHDDTEAMELDEAGKEATGTSEGKGKDPKGKTALSFKANIARRVAVKLPFGIGFFNIASVKSKEVPASYSDAKLASRWKGLLETASMFAGTVDPEAVPAFLETQESISSPQNETESSSMDLDEQEGSTNEKENAGSQTRKRRLLPLGAGLISTAQERGRLLHEASITDLDKILDPPLFHASAVLGGKDNPGVPTLVREKEEKREQYIRLKAKVLQLRNEFCRQHRIRLLNEKTYQATQDRAARIDELVTEMRTDLKSLKTRLDDEARALGIDEEEEKRIFLQAHYDETSIDSPFSKRARTRSHSGEDMDVDSEDEEEEDGMDDDVEEEDDGVVEESTADILIRSDV